MRRIAFGNALAALALSASVTIEALEDWPQWRGPHRNGTSAEKNLLKSWPQGGPPLAWKTGGAGEGYSSFAVPVGGSSRSVRAAIVNTSSRSTPQVASACGKWLTAAASRTTAAMARAAPRPSTAVVCTFLAPAAT